MRLSKVGAGYVGLKRQGEDTTDFYVGICAFADLVQAARELSDRYRRLAIYAEGLSPL